MAALLVRPLMRLCGYERLSHNIMLQYIVKPQKSFCSGNGERARLERGVQAGDGLVAADQREERGHFGTRVAAGERAAERQEQGLAGSAGPLPDRSDEL